MIIDCNQSNISLPKNWSFDIAIFGAGITGISLAMSLPSRLKVGLFEAGPTLPDGESQSFYKGYFEGQNYFALEDVRTRCFGGTSHQWCGMSRLLDKHDFDKNDYHELSGWPIALQDLIEYTKTGYELLRLENDRYSRMRSNNDLFLSSDLKEIDFMWSEETDFNELYYQKIKHSRNIHCFINAPLVDINLERSLTSVKACHILTGRKISVEVSAQHYCLAAGGIENARMLLHNNSQIDCGIGNQHENVGRYFCEHPHFTVGYVKFNRTRNPLNHHLKDGYGGFFSPTQKLMNAEKILNFGLRVDYPAINRNPDVLVKRGILNIVSKTRTTRELWRRLRNSDINFEKILADGEVMIASEQSLNRNNRITLGSELDDLGIARPVLHWNLGEIEFNTFRIGALRFADALKKTNYGNLELADWLTSRPYEFPQHGHEIGAGHHMCTTRMSDDPSLGVVDENQKVHGMDNLFVAGTSVFSTAGHANPTLTMVLLNLRLAEHLSRLNNI